MLSLKPLVFLTITCAFSSVLASLEERSGSLSDLFPIGSGISSWTTSSLATDRVVLADSTFRPFDEIKALSHEIVVAPDNRQSMKAHYPEGSYNFQHSPQGGFSFYAPGPEHVDLTIAKEATFGYTVYFPYGFDFVKGGKLPGLYGGDTVDESVGCSGGRRDVDCFSVRLMWRVDGKGEIYSYLPPFDVNGYGANEVQCLVPPQSVCDPQYGNSVGRGAFSFAPGTRTYVAQRIKLNDPGTANGEMELWANGKSVIKVAGLIIRDTAEGRIRGIQFQTFFGGSDSSWATPKDQDVYFSDFSVAITETI